MTTGKRKISDNELRDRIAHREHQILLAENKRLREALEIYGNVNQWHFTKDKYGNFMATMIEYQEPWVVAQKALEKKE